MAVFKQDMSERNVVRFTNQTFRHRYLSPFAYLLSLGQFGVARTTAARRLWRGSPVLSAYSGGVFLETGDHGWCVCRPYDLG